MDLEIKRNFFEIKYKKNETLDLPKIFGNNNPIHLEIGSGRGEFIYMKALQNPNINFIAVDIKEKRIKAIIRKLDMKTHPNVRVIKMFVDEESIKIFPFNTIRYLYIMFPDPWPKRKHHKRRMINDKFIEVLYRLLSFNGVLEIVTDHKGYAEWIKNHFINQNKFTPIYKNIFTRIPEENHIETYFELKMKKEGFIPFYFKFLKNS